MPRKRRPVKTAIEVVLFFVGLTCMIVACLGRVPWLWWYVGMFISSVGLALDPYGHRC